MISKKVDPRVRALMEFHEADGEPAALISRLCVDLLSEADAGVPVDLEVLASFRNAHVTHVEQEQAETIHWDGRNFRIHLRDADTTGRQRFSCAHAIVHTWFLESAVSGQDGPDTEQGWSEAEEELCDLGAAALLLPEAAFRAACPASVTMADVLDLAEGFQASAEATALRAVALSATPLSMVVLEMTLKPAEKKALAVQRSQPSFPGFDGPRVAPRLRVAKSFGQGMGYVPRHKSVGDATPLASVIEKGGVDYVGEIGILGGTYRVSARNLPMKRGRELVDRVVALIAPQP
jgi:IrrE N-terminal-like domain